MEKVEEPVGGGEACKKARQIISQEEREWGDKRKRRGREGGREGVIERGEV